MPEAAWDIGRFPMDAVRSDPFPDFMSSPSSRLLCAWLASLAGFACVGAEEQDSGPAKDLQSLTAEEFREVLAKGTIRPVQELEGEDAFAASSREQGEFQDPERALASLEAEASGAGAPGGAGERREAGPAAEQNPYLSFGERIKVYPDGTITKPYPLRVGTGEKMKALIEAYGNFPLWNPELGAVSTPDMVKLENLPEWDVELYQDLRAPAPGPGAPQFGPAPQALADWLVVTAGFELLSEVEDFINLFAAGVPQIEIEAKIVEISFSDSLDLGSTTTLAWPTNTLVSGVESNTPNVAQGLGGLFTLAAVQNGVAFDAVLEALASRENVAIISQPKIAVREGGRADILNTTRTPFVEITTLNPTGGFNAKLSYIETGVKLFVVPRVVRTQTIALNIDIEASQQSGNQVTLVSGSEEVSVPITSNRGAHTVVYLQPGQAVILGGLISERTVDRTRKTPILGDIPLLKYLFSAKLSVKEQSNVLFFIRPRILQGAELHREF